MDVLATRDGKPIAGWIFKANREVYDVEAAIEVEGMVTNWSLNQTYRIDLLAPGQRCFLYVGGSSDDGRSERMIIGVGEVVGEAYTARASNDGHWSSDEVAGSHHQFVDVRILPLRSPIQRADLRGHPVLGGCELIRSPQQGNPMVLRPDELAALDEFDLTTIAPTPAQMQSLTGIEIEPVLIVYGDDEGTFVVGDTGEGSWQVLHEIAGEEAEVLGEHDSFSAAVQALSDTWSALGKTSNRTVPGDEDIDRNPALPLATVHWFEDLSLALMKGAEDYFTVIEFSTPDAEDAEIVGEFEDLGDALLAIAEHLESGDEADEDEHSDE